MLGSDLVSVLHLKADDTYLQLKKDLEYLDLKVSVGRRLVAMDTCVTLRPTQCQRALRSPPEKALPCESGVDSLLCRGTRSSSARAWPEPDAPPDCNPVCSFRAADKGVGGFSSQVRFGGFFWFLKILFQPCEM